MRYIWSTESGSGIRSHFSPRLGQKRRTIGRVEFVAKLLNPFIKDQSWECLWKEEGIIPLLQVWQAQSITMEAQLPHLDPITSDENHGKAPSLILSAIINTPSGSP